MTESAEKRKATFLEVGPLGVLIPGEKPPGESRYPYAIERVWVGGGASNFRPQVSEPSCFAAFFRSDSIPTTRFWAK